MYGEGCQDRSERSGPIESVVSSNRTKSQVAQGSVNRHHPHPTTTRPNLSRCLQLFFGIGGVFEDVAGVLELLHQARGLHYQDSVRS